MNFCRHCGTGLMAPPPALPTPVPVRSASTPPSFELHTCRRCGQKTQAGFAFCQHCGAMLPTAPGGPMRPTEPGHGEGGEAMAPTLSSGVDDAMAAIRGGAVQHMVGKPVITAQGAAVPPLGVPMAPHPTPPGGSKPIGSSSTARAPRPGERVWGVLYTVKRDGTDGESYPLSGDWVEVGRQAADLAFDDRYLSPRHARFENQPGQGCRVVPIDLLNGVFKKIRTPQVLASGAHLLIGRELLRFEVLDGDERDAVSLMRFGVTMFGSPPRKPWGRLMQLLSNGGMRDVRHLAAAEVTLGREEGDIVFRDDEFLSRRHATLRWQSGQCVVEDLKSSNGTFVRLRGPTPLEHGDTLRMGDQMFRIELGGA